MDNTKNQIDVQHLQTSSRHPEKVPPNNNIAYTLLKHTWDSLNTDHKLGHKIHLHKFKRTDILQNMSSKYNGMKLKISNTNKFEKLTNVEIKQFTPK